MASTPGANISFLPWVRQGAAAAIAVADTLGPNLRAAAELTAALSINDAPALSVPVRLRGPADVVGIDANEIVRMDPKPGTSSFEPNYFPCIEFDRPDFPWLFTPARADAQSRLRPWLCLVVVRRQTGVLLRPATDGPLPAVEIAAPALPAAELPDLSDCWAWAHAQAASGGTGAQAVRGALAGRPELSLSRLLCPRLLAPETDYIACLVPTFDVGRKAGLGLPILESELTAANGLAPAWSVAPTVKAVTLPVYHHWAFRTGAGGDFESLVRLLHAQPAPATLGSRAIDISRPGFGLPASFPAGSTLALEGALQPMDSPATPAPWPTVTAEPFQTVLARIVNAPGASETADPAADPLLAPPLYGRWHAARNTVTRGAAPWFDQLNLDPRYRVVAAFGTRVVQEHQEALMAAAWAQAAELQRANQRMRQLQLSLAVGGSLYLRHFSRLTDEAVLRIGAPAFGRVRAGMPGEPGMPTLMRRLANSALPVQATSTAMRRIGRERGPLTRRLVAQGSTRSTSSTWIGKINTGTLTFFVAPSFDLASFGRIRRQLPATVAVREYADVGQSLVAGIPGRIGFQIAPEGAAVGAAPMGRLPQTADSVAARAFRAAAAEHLARIEPGRMRIMVGPPAPLAIDQVRAGLMAQIQPRLTLVALARALVLTGGTASTPVDTPASAAAGIDTIMAAPRFRQPMYEPLRDQSQELLLPGLDAVLPNSVLGLKTNRRFVEAYLVGLNVEMGRELLWRGFPTDQRGTCFDQFWDVRTAPVPRPDIAALHQWANRVLGDVQGAPVREQFVMLLRSDLLRRYPTAVIYAARAVRLANGLRGPSPEAEVFPAFRGTMQPDVSFFGFDLTVPQVVGGAGDDGYYIVIQEQPTEPRFGLDVGTPTGSASHLRANAAPPAGLPLNGLSWGHNAAHMAGITRQQPVRIAIHASQFVARR